jgi:hypothetical protein
MHLFIGNLRAPFVMLLLMAATGCVQQQQPYTPPPASKKSQFSAGAQYAARRAVLVQQLKRIREKRVATERAPVSFLGVKVSAPSLSQIARGLQRSDDPVDKPTRPEPELNFPTVPDEAPLSEDLPANDAILDERTLMLLAEAERIQSSMTEPLLSELARGSLTSEAFDRWSEDLKRERRQQFVILAVVLICGVVLIASGIYLFRYILEEMRISRLPTFGR